MSYRHPRLAGTQPNQVAGGSQLLWRDTTYRPRDHFDPGAQPYEHLLELDRAVAWLKRSLG